MIPTHSNFRGVKSTDIHGLVLGEAEEGLQLEFKLDAYGDLREWGKDITAFANTEGGVIVMGVRDEGGVAKEIVGIPAGDVDTRIRALTQNVCSTVRPVPAIGYEPVDVGGGRVVLLAAVGPSRFRPHACQQGTRFYKRMPRNAQEMNREDLERAFAGSQTEEEAALRVHIPRVDVWQQRSGNSVVVILDAIPAPLDQERFNPNDEAAIRSVRAVFDETKWQLGQNRVVFDGLSYTRDRDATQVQRSGAVLAVQHHVPLPKGDLLPAVDFTGDLISAVALALRAIRVLDPVCQAHLCLSIVRCRGWTLRISERWMSEPKPIQEDRLGFPVLFWDGLDASDVALMRLMRDWLDRMWNAAGLRPCPLYKRETGEPDWAEFSRWG